MLTASGMEPGRAWTPSQQHFLEGSEMRYCAGPVVVDLWFTERGRWMVT